MLWNDWIFSNTFPHGTESIIWFFTYFCNTRLTTYVANKARQLTIYFNWMVDTKSHLRLNFCSHFIAVYSSKFSSFSFISWGTLTPISFLYFITMLYICTYNSSKCYIHTHTTNIVICSHKLVVKRNCITMPSLILRNKDVQLKATRWTMMLYVQLAWWLKKDSQSKLVLIQHNLQMFPYPDAMLATK